MSDAARQAENANARKQMAKTRAGISDAARHENNAKARKHMAKARAKMGDASRQAYNAPRHGKEWRYLRMCARREIDDAKSERKDQH